MHAHIYDVGVNLPPEIGARFWIAMAAPEASVYLPFYGNITDTHPKYKYNITDVNGNCDMTGKFGTSNLIPAENSDSAYLIFARTGYLARGDRLNYVAPIQEFWVAYELMLYEDQEKIIVPELLKQYKESPAAASKFATDYTIALTDVTFNAAIKIHDALVAHMATAPNTLFVIPAAAKKAMEEAHALAQKYVEEDCIDKIKDKLEESGCDAGLGYVALGLFGLIMFARRRSK